MTIANGGIRLGDWVKLAIALCQKDAVKSQIKIKANKIWMKRQREGKDGKPEGG